MRKLNKKGATGQIGGLVGGIIGLVFLVVVGFVMIDVLTSANLLTAGGDFDTTVDNLTANLTDGVDEVALKIPTIFTIAAAVLLLGFVVFLVIRARQMQMGQGTI